MVHLNPNQWFDKFGRKQRGTNKDCHESSRSENGGRVPDHQCNGDRRRSQPYLAKILKGAGALRAILGMGVVDAKDSVFLKG